MTKRRGVVSPPGIDGPRRAGEIDYSYQKDRMLELIRARGVRDERVLKAMAEVPRHLFVGHHLKAQAYGDFALPIGVSQTISQPYIVARMSELLEVHPEHSVLEIGTGSGYQTAILAKLARRVYSIERHAALAQQAISRIRELGLSNVKIQIFDGTVGWSDAAPYQRILVTAAAPKAPDPLLEQLDERGRLVIPEGGRASQWLVTYDRGRRGPRRRQHEQVAFVPLVGRHGWSEE